MPARSAPAAGSISAAASRPGIDPRIWLSLAVVNDVGFDPKEGTFVDLQLVPSGEAETAYLGAPYAGAGFGDHCPVEKGDLLVVGIPGGDAGNGPVIVARFCSSGDPPHPEVGALEKTSRVIRAKPGERVVLRTSLAGALSLVSEGAGDAEVTSIGGMVQLGNLVPGAPALDFTVLATPLMADLVLLSAQLKVLTAALGAYAAAIQPIADPTAAATPVLASAIAAFQAAIAAVPNPTIPATKVRAT